MIKKISRKYLVEDEHGYTDAELVSKINEIIDYINAEQPKCIPVKSKEQEPSEDVVSRGVFEQVMWERDIAIQQLKELGYEFGEKIEPQE